MSAETALARAGYRPAIDGLRAIAVLAVVVYHAVPEWAPGGFVGVDVFFVISGFLLTGIIQRELEHGAFSFGGFYLRRARRILPAFLLMAFVCLVFGLLWLTPSELRAQAKLTLASTLSVGNVELWLEAGYFANASEFKPLLHTWSLGVEEQFYLFWPWLLLALRSWPRLRWVTIFAIAAASLWVSCWGVTRHPDATFFLLHARAWELLLGALVALAPTRSLGRAVSHLMSGLGLACLAYAVARLDSEVAFPGMNALLPAGGSALLLASEATGFVGSRWLLGARPLVFVGLISYSLYLWHWPLLAFARIGASSTDLPRATALALVALAFLVATASWRWIERPFRTGAPRSVARVLGAYGVAVLVLAGCGGLIFARSGIPSRVSASVGRSEGARKDRNPLRAACESKLDDYERGAHYQRSPACFRAAAQAGRGTFVVWGDSHADALAPGLRQVAAAHGYATLEATASACPPLPNVAVMRTSGEATEGCPEFNREVLEYLTHASDVSVVALVARWPIYTEASRPLGEGRRAIPFLRERPGQVLSRETSREILRRNLARTVEALEGAHKSVVMVGPVPEVGLDVPGCWAHAAMPLKLRADCEIDASPVRERERFATELLKGYASRACLRFPADVLCGDKSCRTLSEGKPLYVDSNHVSRTAANSLARELGLASCLSGVEASN